MSVINPYQFPLQGSSNINVSGSLVTSTGTTTATYPYTSGIWTGGTSQTITVSPLPIEPAMLSFETTHGKIVIRPDGSVDVPEGVDDAAKEFWEALRGFLQGMIHAEVQRQAAQAVRTHLPRLLPDLDEYHAKTLPSAIAAAIENEGAKS